MTPAEPSVVYVDWYCGFCGHKGTVEVEELSAGAKCLRCRDEFARAALSGYLASIDPEDGGDPPIDETARDCYRYADAMLAEREKERNG